MEKPWPPLRPKSRAPRTLIFVLVVKHLQVRHLLATRRTPRCPEIYQHHLAFHVSQMPGLPWRSESVKSAFWRLASSASSCATASLNCGLSDSAAICSYRASDASSIYSSSG